MPIGDNQIDLGCSAIAEILQEAVPAIFVFLCTRAESQHLSVSLQINAQRRENHGCIGFGPMTNREMDAIQIQNTVVGEQGTLAPGFILLGQRLNQTTDGTSAGRDPIKVCATSPTLCVLTPLTNIWVSASATSGS